MQANLCYFKSRFGAAVVLLWCCGAVVVLLWCCCGAVVPLDQCVVSSVSSVSATGEFYRLSPSLSEPVMKVTPLWPLSLAGRVYATSFHPEAPALVPGGEV